MKQKKRTVAYNFRADVDLLERVRELAKKEHRSIVSIFHQAVDEFLAKKEAEVKFNPDFFGDKKEGGA